MKSSGSTHNTYFRNVIDHPGAFLKTGSGPSKSYLTWKRYHEKPILSSPLSDGSHNQGDDFWIALRFGEWINGWEREPLL